MPDRGISSIFGLTPSMPFPDFRAIPALLVESYWSHPLLHIFECGGWTIDDVCRSRRIAAEVRVLWKIFKAAERQRLERERKNAVREKLVYRKEGLPVACPLCGEPGACACRLDSMRSLQEGTGFGRVSKERPRYRPFRQASFPARHSGQ
jgi:hypothetical protein